MKGRWESNKNFWFPFMYSQKWYCAASLFPKHNYNVLLPIPTLIYMWEIYKFPGSVCLFCRSKICGPIDRSWKFINLSQTHVYRNWDWGRAIPFLGIHKLDFRYNGINMKCFSLFYPNVKWRIAIFFFLWRKTRVKWNWCKMKKPHHVSVNMI